GDRRQVVEAEVGPGARAVEEAFEPMFAGRGVTRPPRASVIGVAATRGAHRTVSRSLLCCGRISVPPAENPLARSRDTASQQSVGSRKLPAARRLATARRAKGGGAAEARASPVPNSLAMTIAPRGCHPIEVGAGAAACAPVSPRLVVELDADVASGDDGLGA